MGVSGGEAGDQMPPFMEFDNDDVICSSPIKNPKVVARASALVLNTLSFSLKHL